MERLKSFKFDVLSFDLGFTCFFAYWLKYSRWSGSLVTPRWLALHIFYFFSFRATMWNITLSTLKNAKPTRGEPEVWSVPWRPRFLWTILWTMEWPCVPLCSSSSNYLSILGLGRKTTTRFINYGILQVTNPMILWLGIDITKLKSLLKSKSPTDFCDKKEKNFVYFIPG